MYARITKYKMKAGSRDEAVALMESIKGQIMALNGVRHFYNCGNDDGSGYVISIVDSKEQSDANAEGVKAIWAGFAPLMEAAPTAEGYDVLADWSN